MVEGTLGPLDLNFELQREAEGVLGDTGYLPHCLPNYGSPSGFFFNFARVGEHVFSTASYWAQQRRRSLVTAAACLHLEHSSAGDGPPSAQPAVPGGGRSSGAWNIFLSVPWQQFHSRSVGLRSLAKVRGHLGAQVSSSLILVAPKRAVCPRRLCLRETAWPVPRACR